LPKQQGISYLEREGEGVEIGGQAGQQAGIFKVRLVWERQRYRDRKIETHINKET
jgi:hypothetical protein